MIRFCYTGDRHLSQTRLDRQRWIWELYGSHMAHSCHRITVLSNSKLPTVPMILVVVGHFFHIIHDLKKHWTSLKSVPTLADNLARNYE